MRNRLLVAVTIMSLLAALAVAFSSRAVAQLGDGPVIYGCIHQGGSGTEAHELYGVSRDTPRPCVSSDPQVSWQGLAAPSPSPSATPSPTASTTPSATPSASPSASPTSTGTACVIGQGGICGAYDYAPNAMSNGYNTYVMDQSIGPNSGSSSTLTAYDPGNWSTVQNDVPYGYGGVQVGPGVQQQLDDWCGTVTNWGSCPSPTDTPLASLNSLAINYNETSPQDSNSIYEFAADAWPGNYGSDVMFWVDTHGRCNEGSYGGTILGTATFDGQTWTVNRYGGPGAEIIFVLDSDPGTPNSCAQQSSGSIDVLAGLKWLVANGYMSSLGSMGLLNAVWEITSADNTTFTMNSYSLTAS